MKPVLEMKYGRGGKTRNRVMNENYEKFMDKAMVTEDAGDGRRF